MYLEADQQADGSVQRTDQSSTWTQLHAALQEGQVVGKKQTQLHITLCCLLLTAQKHSSSQNTGNQRVMHDQYPPHLPSI